MSVVLVFILSLLATYFVYHRRFYLLLLKIPATSFPIRILMKSILRFDVFELYHKITDIIKNTNGLGVFWILYKPFVCVTLPEDLKIVLNSKHCQSKPSYLKILFGEHTENLIFGSREVWRSHRRILNPYFTSQSMPSLFPMLKERVKILMKMMEKKERQGEFNIFNVMTAMSLETTLSVMELEVDIQSLSEEKRDVFRLGVSE
jgi:cytochrome P450